MNVFLENHPINPASTASSFKNSLDAFRQLENGAFEGLSFEWGIHERLFPCCPPTSYTFKTMIT